MDVSCGIGCFVSELRGLVGSWVFLLTDAIACRL